MKKPNKLGVTSVLIACLLADPGFVQAIRQTSKPQSPPSPLPFTEQALASTAIGAVWRGPFKMLQKLPQRQLLPIKSPHYQPIVPFLLQSMESRNYLHDIIPKILDEEQRVFDLSLSDVETLVQHAQRGGPAVVIDVEVQENHTPGTRFIARPTLTVPQRMEIIPQQFEPEFASLSLERSRLLVKPQEGSLAKTFNNLGYITDSFRFKDLLKDLVVHHIARVVFCVNPHLAAVEETFFRSRRAQARGVFHPILFEPGYEDLLLGAVIKIIENLRTEGRSQALSAFFIHFTQMVGVTRVKRALGMPGVDARPLLLLYNVLVELAKKSVGDTESLRLSSWIQSHPEIVIPLIDETYNEMADKFGRDFLYRDDGKERFLLPIRVRFPLRRHRSRPVREVLTSG